jgi:ankyrin repeat protein
MTAVHIDASFGLLDAVQEKFLKGYKLDGKDSARNTPLSYATKHEYTKVADLLPANDTDPDTGYSSSDTKRTPLSFAAENGHEQVVRLLLETGAPEGGEYVYAKTPPMHASEKGHLLVVQMLLQKGAHVGTRDEKMTALSYAAQNGHVEIVRALLDRGAHPQANWVNGVQRFRTPLSSAIEGGHAAVVWFLLEHGANVEAYDIFNRTPLSYAAGNEAPEVIDLLIGMGGANINAYEYSGEAPMSHAAARGDLQLVKLLLDRGVDPNMFCTFDENDMGSPLLSAVRGDYTELVKLLMNTGKVWTDPTEEWEGAAANHFLEDVIRKLLKTEGVDPNSKDGAGMTPLAHADEESSDGVEILLADERIDSGFCIMKV